MPTVSAWPFGRLHATCVAATLCTMETTRDTRPFASELENHRKARRLTPAQMARAIGASTSQVSRWRKGGGISVDQLQQVADWMERPIEKSLLPQAGFPVRAGNTSSAHETGDQRLPVISAIWADLNEERRRIIYEVALAGTSTEATHGRSSAPTSSPAPQSTGVRDVAQRHRFTGRDLEDLLRRLPQLDPDFEADLAQMRNEWRAAHFPGTHSRTGARLGGCDPEPGRLRARGRSGRSRQRTNVLTCALQPCARERLE